VNARVTRVHTRGTEHVIPRERKRPRDLGVDSRSVPEIPQVAKAPIGMTCA